jgi:hypothetical protein
VIQRPCIEQLPTGRLCGRPSPGSRCPEHARPRYQADNRRRNAKTVAHGVKRSHFQRLRPERIALAGGFCELHVDRDCKQVATTVHIDSGLGGNHDEATIDDCRAACDHCHGVMDGRRSHMEASV